ncbi:hypothetical protein K493DRAFT_299626 [Basidiobolus meristosporus CBS 931.73]|uniref:SH3 domain-containing protein n=1 Tax=Basidiobolus meristosporus CBS 931.73 TaxID=1314790 RepID=A0A1Y1YML8_9FUNG|nr:hypothetical protein K493DRAFT_299626 [Basidiobolus meristosporus CBS 931.73]|eukprot:ORX98986.1 hypothetical protein K493DRAFT_299626 [Basidiobolus meristosporus CBS 931.73]
MVFRQAGLVSLHYADGNHHARFPPFNSYIHNPFAQRYECSLTQQYRELAHKVLQPNFLEVLWWKFRNAMIDGVNPLDVASFDRALEFYFGSPKDIDQINKLFDCKGGVGWNGIEEPPFRSTFTCRALLEHPLVRECNIQNPIPPICKSTCIRYVQGWSDILLNSTACPSSLEQREAKVKNLYSWCEAFPNNGTDGNCVDGEQNESRTCGFMLPAQYPTLCNFCQTSNNSCCKSEATKLCSLANHEQPLKKNSMVFVLSGIFGSVGVVALVLGALFYIRRRRQSQMKTHSSQSISSSTNLIANSLPYPPPSPPPSAQSDGEGYTCVFAYTPTLEDELMIQPGDMLIVIWSFDDGWAVGRNLNTGNEGAFPMACVTKNPPSEILSSDAEKLDGEQYPRTSSKHISERLSFNSITSQK